MYIGPGLPPKRIDLYNRSMSRTSNIHRLQSLELELQRLADRKEEIDRILESSDEVARAHKKMERSQRELVEARSAMGAAEQEVAAQESKIEKSESSLYGGSVTDPKQLEELQLESASLRKHLQTLEERQLEQMLKLDEAESDYETAKADLERTQAQIALQHAGLAEERQAIIADIERLSTEREAAQANIPAGDLQSYRRIQKRVGPRALATVQDRSCSACGMAIPPSQLQAIRSTSDLARCEQCGRILYEE